MAAEIVALSESDGHVPKLKWTDRLSGALVFCGMITT
jgi:hypothetical protein